MPKLNQILAVEKGTKSRTKSLLTEVYKMLQKPDMFTGFTKEYKSLDEDGEALPPEGKKVQAIASILMKEVQKSMTTLLDTTARKDWTNCVAKANIKVNNKTILKDVPVTYLLFLEKQLIDMHTMFSTLPVLDASEDWNKDDNSGLYKSQVTQTHRNRKESKPIVLFSATPEHPAQTQMVTEDVLAGHWHQRKYSGAFPAPLVKELQERTIALIDAVKTAREAANGIEEIDSPEVGAALFAYLFPTIDGGTKTESKA